jgi:hypothetical protein
MYENIFGIHKTVFDFFDPNHRLSEFCIEIGVVFYRLFSLVTEISQNLLNLGLKIVQN